jgi:hypothetical protein
VSVTVEGTTVRATVRLRSSPMGTRLPGFDVSATAVAALEPQSQPAHGPTSGQDAGRSGGTSGELASQR